MDRKRLLLARLDDIGRSLEQSGQALALIGLGSAGLERDRMDEYSDLDFFAIVEEGRARRYIEDLGWLARVAPVAYHFQNTADGHKLLFADGVFCEFAVFDPPALRGIPFAPGRVIWRRADVDDSIALPARPAAPVVHDRGWLLGEALINLYVGLCRWRRGEKLSGSRLVQQHAVDRVLELVELIDSQSPASRDPFTPERRFESRHPGAARELPKFVPGYDRTPQAAQEVLDWLEKNFPVNPAMARAIRDLCESAGPGAR